MLEIALETNRNMLDHIVRLEKRLFGGRNPIFQRIRKPIKKFLFSLVASSIFLAPFAAGGELYFRRMAGQERPWLVQEHQLKDVAPNDFEVRSYIPGLSYLNSPGASISNDEKANGWGYHDDEFIVPKPAGVFRIAVVGDSMTYGAAVSKSETYSNRLEEKLNKTAAGEQKFDVANLGVAGYQVIQAYSTMKNIAIPFLDPDLVIYAFSGNDHNDFGFNFFRSGSKYPYSCFEQEELPGQPGVFNIFLKEKIRFILEKDSALYAEFKYRSEIFRYEHVLPKIQLIGNSIDNDFLKQVFWTGANVVPYFYPYNNGCSRYELSYVAIQDMVKLAKRDSIKFIIANMPVLAEKDCDGCDYPARDFLKLVSSNNPDIQIYSPHEYMRMATNRRGLSPSDTRVSDTDPHPSVLGHQLIAEGIYDYLMENKGLLESYAER